MILCARIAPPCSHRETTSNPKPQTLNFVREEGIMPLLLSHSGHRAMAGTNDCLVRQRQNFLEIISNCVVVGNGPATHRAGKKRVANDSNRPPEASYDKSHSTGRMSPSQSRFDVDLANAKVFSFVDLFRARNRFAFRRENFGSRFFAQPWQVSHMIRMSVCEQNEFDAQIFFRRQL